MLEQAQARVPVVTSAGGGGGGVRVEPQSRVWGYYGWQSSVAVAKDDGNVGAGVVGKDLEHRFRCTRIAFFKEKCKRF